MIFPAVSGQSGSLKIGKPLDSTLEKIAPDGYGHATQPTIAYAALGIKDYIIVINRTDLFLAKIKIDPDRGCWLWIGHVNKVHGYGQFWDGERVVGAHVFSFRRFNGPIPSGKEPDHLCRVRHCVHPDHLEAVTRRVNLLRGDTIPARKAAQLNCEQGHPLAGDNIYRHKNGTRACRICRAEDSRVWANNNRARRREIDRESYRRRRGKTGSTSNAKVRESHR